MRGIYKQFLTSKNLVADALSIRDSINESQCETLKKMQFLVRAISDANHGEYGGEPVSSVYSVGVMNSDKQTEYFVPSIINWSQIVRFGYSQGFCYIDVENSGMLIASWQCNTSAGINGDASCLGKVNIEQGLDEFAGISGFGKISMPLAKSFIDKEKTSMPMRLTLKIKYPLSLN